MDPSWDTNSWIQSWGICRANLQSSKGNMFCCFPICFLGGTVTLGWFFLNQSGHKYLHHSTSTSFVRCFHMWLIDIRRSQIGAPSESFCRWSQRFQIKFKGLVKNDQQKDKKPFVVLYNYIYPPPPQATVSETNCRFGQFRATKPPIEKKFAKMVVYSFRNSFYLALTCSVIPFQCPSQQKIQV